MSVYKNEKNNTWYVMVYYNDWKGERKQKCQRGFSTKQQAQNWERQFKYDIKKFLQIKTVVRSEA